MILITDQKLGKTFKMFAGFIDEDADKFAVRMICKDQASTVNHFVDHSVESLVNAIDGIGNSADEISVLVRSNNLKHFKKQTEMKISMKIDHPTTH